MKTTLKRIARIFLAALLLAHSPAIGEEAPRHGIAMYGEPALPPDFVSLPYANPEAPKGGRIVFGDPGGFDSLNPYILKGRAPWGVRAYVVESLMGRNWDEPFSLYGLLAESITVGPNREWVEFTLRPEAKFSDGSPVTIEDVMWSFRTLGEHGHPRYRTAWKKIATMEQTGPRAVRFTFNTKDRELPLILGLRPILKKAQWEGRDFEKSGVDVVPIGSGPYVIADFKPGEYITFRRNPDYWGRDLAFNRGRHNLDEIRHDYYADGSVLFEAFRGGETSVFREGSAANWIRKYDFPAVKSGEIVKSEIPHQRPTGYRGLVMNTRRPIFKDWRVREALITAFNYEYVNTAINGVPQPRIKSYFSNSVLGMREGPAKGRVRELLAPYGESLLPGALEGYSLPKGDGTERNRKGLRRALKLLGEAGWQVKNGVLQDAAGQPFTFEILLRQGDRQTAAIVDLYVEALKRLGITPTVTTIDSAQYKERTNIYDFDMTYYRRGASLSPGNEQKLYWGSQGLTEPGTRNWMGVASPAVDALIDAMVNAPDQAEFIATTRALDRVLASGRYVIPFWYSPVSRLAHRRELKYPEKLPIYGDWIGFLPDVWWYEK